MKTIFISSFHVLVSRNIISTAVIDLLIERGFSIVVIVPQSKADYFKKKFGDKVTVEGIPNRLNRLDNLFKDLALAAVRTRALSIMRRRNMGMERPIFQKVFFFAPLIRPIISFLYRQIIPSHSHHQLFEKYRPAALFSTDVFSANDCRLMIEAKVHKVPFAGMVRSWDNLTTKGGFRIFPDILVTQNDIAKREAVEIHRVEEDKIVSVGIPHYDKYLSDPVGALDIGVPAGNKFVVYAPLGDRVMKVGDRVQKHRFDAGMIDLLDRILPSDVYLLVRLPPTDTVTVNRESLSDRVLFQEPGVRFGAGVKGIRSSEMSPEDDRLLLETLRRSSVVINPFSSLCVDAAILDRPIVVPAFDPYPVPWVESVRRVQEFEHFQEVIRSGGVAVVLNEGELAKALSRYISDPGNDKEERRRFAESQVFALDGRSSERLSAVVANLATISG